MAVSWGCYESLIMPRYAGFEKNKFDVQNPMHQLIRIYIGLEDAPILIKDLKQAFEVF